MMVMSIDAAMTCTGTRREYAQSAGDRIAALAREAYAAAAIARVQALSPEQQHELAESRARVTVETQRYLSYTAPGF
jgi:hypothetical protein